VRTDLRLIEAATVAGAVTLAAQYTPQFLVVDEPERDVLRALATLRAIVIVDEVPRDAPSSGTRLRLLARPFAAEQLLGEVRALVG